VGVIYVNVVLPSRYLLRVLSSRYRAQRDARINLSVCGIRMRGVKVFLSAWHESLRMHESSSRFIAEDFRIPSFIRLARIRATVPAYCPQRKLLFTAVSGMPYFHAARNRAAAISSAAKAASWFDLSKQELRLSIFRPHDSRPSSPRANSRSFDPRPRARRCRYF